MLEHSEDYNWPQGILQKKLSSEHSWAHYEALANNLVGIAIAQTILFLWGLPLWGALSLNAIFFLTSYLRSYLLRRLFSHLRRSH